MKELKFSHITKTAGTSIEDAGYGYGIKWGCHHLKSDPYWHDPISTFPSELRESYDWFTVVRNPYERILSEYHCPWVKIYDPSHTVADFNRIVCDHIVQRLTYCTASYFQLWRNFRRGHFLEQWRYLDPSVTVHVLKKESLATEFPALMKKYGLPVTLNVTINKGLPKKFGIDDFTMDTIHLINEVYAKDFELFGYSKLLTEVPAPKRIPVKYHNRINLDNLGSIISRRET